jgi:AraC-like DNA-binding protein
LAEIQRFSTADIAGADRLAVWNNASESSIGAMVLDADRDAFEAILTRLKAGRLEIVSVVSAPVVARNTWQSRMSSSGFLLQLVHSGQCLLRHDRFEKIATNGDLLIVDMSKSYELTSREAVHGLTIPLPLERFGQAAEMLERLSVCGIDMRDGPAAVLADFLRNAWDRLGEGDAYNWPVSAEEVVWELLEAIITKKAERRVELGKSDRLRSAAKDYIDARLSDPEFSVSEICQALGVGPRYLQTVFAQVGTTPSRYVLSRRLEVAAEILRRHERVNSITAVALDCGFNDLSYFSRSFRARYQVSPRAFRGSFAMNTREWL